MRKQMAMPRYPSWRVYLVATALIGVLAWGALAEPLRVRAATQTITNASQDTRLQASAPDMNFGGATSITVGGSTTGNNVNRGLWQWNITSIPAGGTITNATITLTSGGGTATEAGINLSVNRVTSAWSEDTATWNNQPTFTTDDAQTVDAATPYTDGVTKLVFNDVTAIFNSWYTGASVNNGVLIKGPEGAPLNRPVYYSSETGTAGFRPTLAVTWDLEPPSIATNAASALTIDKDGVTGGNFNFAITHFGGATNADCHIEYGPTASYGSQTAPVNYNTIGAKSVAIPANSGTVPGATWHYRAVCANSEDSANANDQTYSYSLPTVTTLPATDVSQTTSTTATLNGEITDMGDFSDVYVRFGWGEPPCCLNMTGLQTISAPGGFSAELTGVLPSQSYVYRALVALPNGATSDVGAVLSFEVPYALWFYILPIGILTLAVVTVVGVFRAAQETRGAHIANFAIETAATLLVIAVIVGVSAYLFFSYI